MRTPATVVVRPLFSALFPFYPQLYSASTEPHISPATPHLRHMLRSATRREDWVFLRDTSPDGWAPPSPTAAPSGCHSRPSVPKPPWPGHCTEFLQIQLLGHSSADASQSIELHLAWFVQAPDTLCHSFLPSLFIPIRSNWCFMSILAPASTGPSHLQPKDPVPRSPVDSTS
jgi:hypothetical protein